MGNEEVGKTLDDMQVLMEAMQKEMTGLKMLVDTVGALIDALVDKGVITKDEVNKQLEGKAKK